MSTSTVHLNNNQREYLIDMLETQDEHLREDLDQLDLSPEDRKDLEDQRKLVSSLFAIL